MGNNKKSARYWSVQGDQSAIREKEWDMKYQLRLMPAFGRKPKWTSDYKIQWYRRAIIREKEKFMLYLWTDSILSQNN